MTLVPILLLLQRLPERLLQRLSEQLLLRRLWKLYFRLTDVLCQANFVLVDQKLQQQT